MIFSFAAVQAQEIDINKFIDLVKKNNKDLRLAAKELELAEEQEAEARSNAFPQINAEGSYNRNLKEAYMYADFSGLMDMLPLPPGAPAPSGPSKFKINYKNTFDFQTVVSQQIFNYTVFNAIKAAKQYEKLTDYAYDATMHGIINASKKAFYQTLLLEEVVKVNKNAEKNAKENYDNVKNKFDQGVVSQFELLQAEVRWKNLIPNTTQSERNLQLALNSLKMLAGVPVDSKFDITGTLETFPVLPPSLELTAVLKNRPDYNAMMWEKNLRETNITVEQSGHFPMLYGTFVYKFNAQSDEFKFENDNNYLIAGLTVKIPIFSGMNVSAKVQKAQIEVDKAKIKIAKKEDEIYTELANLSLMMNEAKGRIASAQTTLETAEKAFEIAENSNKNGLATQLELKDARVGFDQATLNYYAAVYDYLEAYFDWQLANGILE